MFLASLGSAFVIPNLIEEVQQVLFNTEDAIIDITSQLTHPFVKNDTKIPYDELPMVDSESLQALITHAALNTSAVELYGIANSSFKEYGHPTRVIGSGGHWKTLGWIEKQLKNMSDYYSYSTQEFKALDGKVFNHSLSINQIKVDNSKPFQLTPAAHIYWADLFVVDNLGCDDADYVGLNATSTDVVALIKRGECPFGNKSSLAGKYGAKGALIYDPASEEIMAGTLGEPTNTTVGTLGISLSTANNLIAQKAAGVPVKINMFIAAYVGFIKTKNIIADTIHGDKGNIVALGAHSDSVEAGPGINDDGSGTISLLNVAKQLTNFQVNNTVRFAWWSAEEEGLLGSNFYAYNLTAEENSNIRLFMDYDMMASPNFEYQVYNGSNEVNPAGSEELKQLYIDYYDSKGLPWVLIPFDGRSDYVGFIETGIPAGGIAAGAEGLNSQNGLVLDQCYHELCDDLTNLNWDAFLVNTQLIAHSVATFAKSLDGFPERSPVKVLGDEKPFKFALNGNFYVL
jgi:aminopeptidase Y